jgi:energy-coupling factor transporter ATP-binding protein EcfA2
MVSSERLTLVKTLSSLPEAQFKHLVFALDPPKGSLPTETSQGKIASVLLDWVESPTGPGMKAFREILNDVLEIKTLSQTAICPYKGLSYFDCNDEDYKYFYGRKNLTQTLIEKVTHGNFLVIVGASGSGKSSVLRAGLLQHLKDQGNYEIRILVPGEHPLQNLAQAFVDEEADRLDRAEQLAKAESLIAEGSVGLRRLVQTSNSQRVALVVDQFEESFTLCQDKTERKDFFQTLLGGLKTASSKLCLILAMRSDFVGKCFEEDYRDLAEMVKDDLQPVLAMSTEELTQAITEPARQTGITLEPGLTDVLLKDIEQSPVGLVLVTHRPYLLSAVGCR